MNLANHLYKTTGDMYHKLNDSSDSDSERGKSVKLAKIITKKVCFRWSVSRSLSH